ncbi:hypothetical protein EE612_055985 [Oryza sativa]|nr:hypothetical protein EE612_055985 [Oryza sativa]
MAMSSSWVVEIERYISGDAGARIEAGALHLPGARVRQEHDEPQRLPASGGVAGAFPSR